jgi:small subunit ribosomal protein S18
MRERRRRTRKKCRLCGSKTRYIDYKNTSMLRDFITEKGKIIPKRITGNCAKHQRLVKEAIQRARHVALLPYTKE